MRVLILGGDGYLGWPTAMRFSGARPRGLRRRQLLAPPLAHTSTSTDSLTPIRSLAERIEAWQRGLRATRSAPSSARSRTASSSTRVIAETLPEAVVHYGEQPSAPYSMMSRETRGRDPVHERDRHPQPAVLDPRPRARLPPGQARDDGRVRDPEHRHRGGVHRDRAQGPQGHAAVPEAARARSTTSPRSTTRTTSTSPAGSGACARPTSTRASSTGSRPTRRAQDERLVTRFDYDEIFGTVLNRFCVQAVIGHPLTVYGKGGQTRGFLNIRDTLQCVELAVDNPADARRVPRLQPVHRAVLGRRAGRAGQARRRASSATRSRSQHLANPRVEPRSTTTTPTNTKLLDLGLEPHHLGEELVQLDARDDRAPQGPRDRARDRSADPLEARRAERSRARSGERPERRFRTACERAKPRIARAYGRWLPSLAHARGGRTDGGAQGRGGRARLRHPRRRQPADLRRARTTPTSPTSRRATSRARATRPRATRRPPAGSGVALRHLGPGRDQPGHRDRRRDDGLGPDRVHHRPGAHRPDRHRRLPGGRRHRHHDAGRQALASWSPTRARSRSTSTPPSTSPRPGARARCWSTSRRTSRAPTSSTSRAPRRPNLPGYKPSTEGNIKQIRIAAKALANAQRPVIYARRRDDQRERLRGAPRALPLRPLPGHLHRDGPGRLPGPARAVARDARHARHPRPPTTRWTTPT